MGSFTVVLDACVLYPAPLRDLLMQMTLADLFRARWTDLIHEEWISNLSANRPDLTRDKLERVPASTRIMEAADMVAPEEEASAPPPESAVRKMWGLAAKPTLEPTHDSDVKWWK